MITATVSAVAYADAENSTILLTWSHGEPQTYPADWKGFYRGATGSHHNGEEIQFIDGTENDADITVMAAFIAAGGVVADHVAPVAPTDYRLYKSTLIRRLAEQEAVTLTALLEASPVKSRMLWDASEWIGSDDTLFADLQQAIGAALGADRAAEILAREA